MIEIDGARYSGSGTIVRQAVALAALTGQAVHIANARKRRAKPGLQLQHLRVVEAVRELARGRTEGVFQGSQDVRFWPGEGPEGGSYVWDIGSAGSTTLLALAVLPVMAFRGEVVEAELRGGVFQDFAPPFFHLDNVMGPLLRRMGFEVEMEMRRPGYVPRGGGILWLRVRPVEGRLRPVVTERGRRMERLWGIALASHLGQRAVARRMAEAAQEVCKEAGCEATIATREDETAVQAGAALAMFADLEGGWRLGADQAGALGRPAEAIGRRVAGEILKEVKSGAAVDKWAADQVLPFAALAEGESRFWIPGPSDHIESNAWLVRKFLGAEVKVEGQEMRVKGVGFGRT